MSCKAGNKKHKERCQRYKSENRRAINKQKKAKRHEKRMQRFADRREAGKTCQYDKERTAQKRKWNEKHPNERYEFDSNVNSNKGRHTDFAKWDSVESFLSRKREEIEHEMAKRAADKNKKKTEESKEGG